MKVVRCTFVVYSVSIGFNEGCKVYIRIQMKMVRCPLKFSRHTIFADHVI